MRKHGKNRCQGPRQLRPDDTIVYEIEGDTVRLRKPAPLDVAHLRALRATLSEWKTAEDAAACDDL